MVGWLHASSSIRERNQRASAVSLSTCNSTASGPIEVTLASVSGSRASKRQVHVFAALISIGEMEEIAVARRKCGVERRLIDE